MILYFDKDTEFSHISQSKKQADFLIDNSCQNRYTFCPPCVIIPFLKIYIALAVLMKYETPVIPATGVRLMTYRDPMGQDAPATGV